MSSSADLFADWNEELKQRQSRNNKYGSSYESSIQLSQTDDYNDDRSDSYYDNDDVDDDCYIDEGEEYGNYEHEQDNKSQYKENNYKNNRKKNKKIEKNRPIFEIIEHGLKISRIKGFTITCMKVNNGIMVLGCREGTILRCIISEISDNSKNLDEISFEPNISIQNIFIDPSGTHILVIQDNGSNFYISNNSTRPKKLVKIGGNNKITSVGWDTNSTSSSTKCVLMGTENGLIYEGIFEDRKEKSLRKVFGISNQGPITGIQFEPYESRKGEIHYLVLLTISGFGRRSIRFFQFSGGPTFDLLFSKYENNNEKILHFQDLPGEIENSFLQTYTNMNNNKREFEDKNKSFSFLTGEGVYHADLVYNQNSDTLIPCNSRLLNLTSKFISFSLTQFHIIVLYDKKIVIYNKLNNTVVHEFNLDMKKSGFLLGLSYDSVYNVIYMFSERRIYQILPQNETKNIWKIFLNRAMAATKGDGPNECNNDFENALRYCSTGQEKQQVLSSHADYLFMMKEYEDSAIIYSQTSRSLEEIALNYMRIQAYSALRIFLLHRLRRLSPEEKMQHTVLCTWLVELYLNEYHYLSFDTQDNSSIDNKGRDATDQDPLSNLLFEFKQFLQDYNNFLDRKTTTNLLLNYDKNGDLLIFYCILVEDFERVIQSYLQREEYGMAIDFIRSLPNSNNIDINKVEALYYKFSNDLILYKPKELFDLWKENKNSNLNLCITRFIPAIVGYLKKKEENINGGSSVFYEFAVDFLLDVIKAGNKEQAVHNYCIFLLVHSPEEKKLIRFLRGEYSGSYNNDESCRDFKNYQENSYLFDLSFALRLCKKYEKIRSCVFLYSLMGMYQEAVEKALLVDFKIAKEMAEMPENEETKKKLWLLIAKHTIDAGSEIKEAMAILKESNNILQIEDILPYFPDFVIINDFKKEICESLQDYNKKIDCLKEDMKGYTEAADVIRDDMAALRKKNMCVSGSQVCDLTGQNLLKKDFYIFPCGHAFHADALKNEISKYFNEEQLTFFNLLQDKLKKLNLNDKESDQNFGFLKSVNINNKRNNKNNPNDKIEKEMIQKQLDDIIASECIFCGEIMIQSVHMPFITEEDESKEGTEWKI